MSLDYIITSPLVIDGPSSSELFFQLGGDSINLRAPTGLSSTYEFVLPPTIGTQDQILTLNSSLETEWTNKNSVFFDITEDTTTFTSTNTTFLVIPSMTLTPPAGTYYCVFCANISNAINYELYEGNNNIIGTERTTFTNSSEECVGTVGIATVDGTQAINVRSRLDSGFSYTIFQRALFINRII